MDWKERKNLRSMEFIKRYKKKLVKCIACNGTGKAREN